MKKLILPILCLSFIYTQCNESNWQEYAPYLNSCTFTDADLSNTDFSGMQFYNVFIKDSNFEGSNFTDANIYETYILNSNFDNTIYGNESFTNVEAEIMLSSFRYCDFSSTYLNGTAFHFSDLQFSNLNQLSENLGGVNYSLLCDTTEPEEFSELWFNYYTNGNILENCEESEPYINLITDLNNDTYDDESYNVGATSGDTNLDGIINVIDIVSLVTIILDEEE